MKAILFCSALALVGFGCKKGSSASSCADAINKGVDTMMAAGAKRMEGAPPAMKAKMDETAVKLKGVITNRCTEDKWSADVIDCYSKAQKRTDLRDCRNKLPEDQQQKLQAEEQGVMMGAGFGGVAPHGDMGSGMADHPPMGSAVAPTAPDGSGMAPPAPAPAGSATAK